MFSSSVVNYWKCCNFPYLSLVLIKPTSDKVTMSKLLLLSLRGPGNVIKELSLPYAVWTLDVDLSDQRSLTEDGT